jgi:hypothetical protein
MAIINNHVTMTLGHADRLAAGDVLFRETTPLYGVLAPVLMGIYERHVGRIAFGDLMHLLIGIEVVYWVAVVYLFARWSRLHWASCLLPIALLLPYYWSASIGLHHPNHSPYRTAGITIALVSLMALRRASACANQWGAGIAAGVALLVNVESGIAATAGLVVYLYRRYGPAHPGGSLGAQLKMVGRFCAALLLTHAAFVLVYRLGLGRWPYAPGLRELFVYARLSSEGYGNRPFLPELYPAAYLAFWPLTIVAHTLWSVFYSAQQRSTGFRPSYRIAVGITLLVWFAYFVNRPDREYIASYLLPYGLLLIDMGRYLGLVFRRLRARFGLRTILAAAIVGHAGLVATTVVEWSWNPMAWRVKLLRAGAPLVWRGELGKRKPPRISRVYLPQSYAESLRDRAGYLREKSGGRRLIYFTVDSYLMPRLSGVLPLQPYTDPIEALTRSRYDRLLNAVVTAPVDEVYVDGRNAAELIWYGGMFDLLRRDLGRQFDRVGLEHGWEVWRRRPEPLARR